MVRTVLLGHWSGPLQSIVERVPLRLSLSSVILSPWILVLRSGLSWGSWRLVPSFSCGGIALEIPRDSVPSVPLG